MSGRITTPGALSALERANVAAKSVSLLSVRRSKPSAYPVRGGCGGRAVVSKHIRGAYARWTLGGLSCDDERGVEHPPRCVGRPEARGFHPRAVLVGAAERVVVPVRLQTLPALAGELLADPPVRLLPVARRAHVIQVDHEPSGHDDGERRAIDVPERL